MPWASPLVGGTTLIRTAIQSPGYVFGVSGWSINKDGSAEFNNVTARGSITASSVSAGSGTVLLNAGGLHIQGSGQQFDINIGAGFLARALPDVGSYAQMQGSTVFLSAPNPTPVNGVAVGNGQMTVNTANSGGNETPTLAVFSPTLSGKAGCNVAFRGQSTGSGVDNSTIDVSANNITLNVATSGRTQFHRGETGSTSVSFSAMASTSFIVTFAKPYIAAPKIFTNIDSGAGSTARWCSRATSITTSQFVYFIFSADNIANTWASVPVSWGAFTLT